MAVETAITKIKSAVADSEIETIYKLDLILAIFLARLIHASRKGGRTT